MVGPISGYSPISYSYGVPAFGNYTGISGDTSKAEDATGVSVGDSKEDSTKKVGAIEKKGECQTCKNRKYVDGSDEMVSFKSPAKIAPGAAASKVRAHEQEHVSNAFSKAEKDGGKVLQASVSMKMAICPECGRAYIAGGETTTKIKYGNEDNPYTKNQKAANYNATTGSNVDAAV